MSRKTFFKVTDDKFWQKTSNESPLIDILIDWARISSAGVGSAFSSGSIGSERSEAKGSSFFETGTKQK